MIIDAYAQILFVVQFSVILFTKGTYFSICFASVCWIAGLTREYVNVINSAKPSICNLILS